MSIDTVAMCAACRVGWRETPATHRSRRTSQVFCGAHALPIDVPLQVAACPSEKVEHSNLQGEASTAGAIEIVRERAFGEPRGF